MILVGNQRGGASDLARHLTKPENERVELHQIRGFVADDLHGAFRESYAISRATRCKQHLFSLSLSPPPEANVEDESFESAIDRAEDRLGLNGHPRAIVFHVKDGRRHAHAVWCRIDAKEMKAVQLSHSHTKLNGLARELYIEHGWTMPKGFLRDHAPNPRNYSLAEWQQAKRASRNPEKLKAMFQDSWAVSDSRASLAAALREHGHILAKGDRRGFVSVDHKGEVYSLSRWVGLKAKDVRARLGPDDGLPNVHDAQAQAAKIITERLEELRREQAEKAKRSAERARKRAEALKAEQHKQTNRLKALQQGIRAREEAFYRQKLRNGLLGLLDRVTGRRSRIEAQFERDLQEGQKKDAERLARLKRHHEDQQDKEQRRAAFVQERRKGNVRELDQDIKTVRAKEEFSRTDRREQFKSERTTQQHERRRSRGRDGPGWSR